MNRKILFVDDEQNILDSFRRQLRNDFEVSVCDNPEKALNMIKNSPQFAVVVADFSMPGMDGVEFLQEVAKCSFETVRVILTGNADLDVAVRAVNECNVYRFLSKPCPLDYLKKVLNEAVTQFGLNCLMSDFLEPLEKKEELISVCSNCKKLRLPHESPFEKKNWMQFELFFSKHYGFGFSHGLCPQCVEKMYEELNLHRMVREEHVHKHETKE
ncbi:MAG: response regulator [Candidatus Cloacimonetes bacterium]|nr:response regulator [Candidatus Cloacimonadota bacterium]